MSASYGLGWKGSSLFSHNLTMSSHLFFLSCILSPSSKISSSSLSKYGTRVSKSSSSFSCPVFGLEMSFRDQCSVDPITGADDSTGRDETSLTSMLRSDFVPLNISFFFAPRLFHPVYALHCRLLLLLLLYCDYYCCCCCCCCCWALC